MKNRLFRIFLASILPLTAFTQNGTVQNAAIPKDAPVNVKMTDFKNNLLAPGIEEKGTPDRIETVTSMTGNKSGKLSSTDLLSALTSISSEGENKLFGSPGTDRQIDSDTRILENPILITEFY